MMCLTASVLNPTVAGNCFEGWSWLLLCCVVAATSFHGLLAEAFELHVA